MLYSVRGDSSGALETALHLSDPLFLDLCWDLAFRAKACSQGKDRLADRRRDLRGSRGGDVRLTRETADADRLQLPLACTQPEGDDGDNDVLSFSFPDMEDDRRSTECRGIQKFTRMVKRL